jgi:hypothetical protein
MFSYLIKLEIKAFGLLNLDKIQIEVMVFPLQQEGKT